EIYRQLRRWARSGRRDRSRVLGLSDLFHSKGGDGIASRRNVIGVNGQLARRLEQIKKGEVDIEVITSRIQDEDKFDIGWSLFEMVERQCW
ncbi:unnamed protein product, partial [Musa acuminata subsp. burmannicoides]